MLWGNVELLLPSVCVGEHGPEEGALGKGDEDDRGESPEACGGRGRGGGVAVALMVVP